MNTSKLLPTAFLVTALLGAGAAIATAQDNTPAPEAPAAQSERAPDEGRGFMERVRDGFGERGDRGDRGERGGKGGHGRHHGQRGGMMMQQILQQADANGDGALTQAEIDAFRTAQLTEHDTDGDGALSIEEYEALHAAMTRDRMVDAFQHLDADGDGEVTAEELDARTGNIVERMDRDGDGAISPADRGHR